MCNKFGILLFVIVTITTSAFSQGRIKVMSYNLLNFNNYTSYCTYYIRFLSRANKGNEL